MPSRGTSTSYGTNRLGPVPEPVHGVRSADPPRPTRKRRLHSQCPTPRISKHGPPICSPYSMQSAVTRPFSVRRHRPAPCTPCSQRRIRNGPRESLGITRDRGWHGLPDYPWGQRAEAFETTLAEAAAWGTTAYARDQALNRAAQRAGVPHDQRHSLAVDEDLVRRYARVTRNTATPTSPKRSCGSPGKRTFGTFSRVSMHPPG